MQSLQLSSQNSTKGGRTFVCNSGNEKFLEQRTREMQIGKEKMPVYDYSPARNWN